MNPPPARNLVTRRVRARGHAPGKLVAIGVRRAERAAHHVETVDKAMGSDRYGRYDRYDGAPWRRSTRRWAAITSVTSVTSGTVERTMETVDEAMGSASEELARARAAKPLAPPAACVEYEAELIRQCDERSENRGARGRT